MDRISVENLKSNYSIRRINSPFDDSGIFLRNVYAKKAMLFDCGRLSSIDNSEIMDISHVFVSHTHIDHFNGFDRFLRAALSSSNEIYFFGPKNFIQNFKGKLDSYTWNLITDYQIVFIVIELRSDGNRAARFAAANSFKEEYIDFPLKMLEENHLLLNESGFSLRYDFLYHGITSLAFRLCEPKRSSIKKEIFEELGFKEGAWVSKLKNYSFFVDRYDDVLEVLTFDGLKNFKVGELIEKLIDYPKPQDIAYITDVAPTLDNYLKATKIAKDSFLLFIESVFMQADIIDSINKHHLTLNLAREIYKHSNSYLVSFGHFSSKYDKDKKSFFKELYHNIDYNRIVKSGLSR